MEKEPMESKRVVLDIPYPLWVRLKAWIDLQGCRTDAEGLRAALRAAIERPPGEDDEDELWDEKDEKGE